MMFYRTGVSGQGGFGPWFWWQVNRGLHAGGRA